MTAEGFRAILCKLSERPREPGASVWNPVRLEIGKVFDMRFARLWLMIVACVMAGMTADAAELRVPGDHATLGAAVAAAAPGDAILITASQTFLESLAWDKRLSLVAAAGVTATIAGDGTSPYVLKTLPGAEGSRIGSADGGAIVVNGDRCALPAGVVTLTHAGWSTEAVTIENVRIGVGVTVANRDDMALVYVPASNGNIQMTNVTMEGGNLGFYLWGTSDGTAINLNNCRVKTRDFAIYYRGSRNDLRAERCEFESTANSTIYYSTSTVNAHVYSQCWIHSSATSPLIALASRYSHLSRFELCALASNYVLAFYDKSYNEQIQFEHCDIVGSAAAGLIRFTKPLEDRPGNRLLQITNSNIVNPAGPAVSTTGAFQDIELTADFNNALVAGAAPFGTGDGFQTFAVTNAVGPVDPGYIDTLNGDYKYTNTYLKTADSRGGAVGSDSVPVPVVNQYVFEYLGRPLMPKPSTIQVVTQDSKSNYQAWATVECPELEGVVGVDTVTGKSTIIETGKYGSTHIRIHRPANGDLYIYAGDPGQFMRYKVNTGELLDLGSPEAPANYWLSQSVGPDGKFYVGNYPNAGVAWVNPANDQTGTTGRLPTDSRQKYVMLSAVSDENILYASVGLHHKELWSYNPANGQKKQLLPAEMLAEQGSPTIFLGTDGHVYGSSSGKNFRCSVSGITYVTSMPSARSTPQNIAGPDRALQLNTANQLVLQTIAGGATRTVQTDFEGVTVEVYCTATEYNGKIYGGAFQPANTWSYDLTTGQLTDHGLKGDGNTQVYDILAHPRGLFHSSYGECKQVLWVPETNAKTHIASLYGTPHQQERGQKLIVGPDSRLYTGTVPIKGLLGGGVLRVDPQTLAWKFWRNVIPNQSFNSVASVPQTGEVFFTSSIAGGTSAIPTETEAWVMLWNPVTESIAWQGKPIPGTTNYGSAVMAGNGLIYGLAGIKYYVFNPVTRQTVRTGSLPVTSVRWPGLADRPNPKDGMIYGLGNDAVFAIDPASETVKIIARHPSVRGVPGAMAGGMMVADDGSIYYGSGSKLYRMRKLQSGAESAGYE